MPVINISLQSPLPSMSVPTGTVISAIYRDKPCLLSANRCVPLSQQSDGFRMGQYPYLANKTWDVCCGFTEERLPLTVIRTTRGAPLCLDSMWGSGGGEAVSSGTAAHISLSEGRTRSWWHGLSVWTKLCVQLLDLFWTFQLHKPKISFIYKTVWIKFSLICNIKISDTSVFAIRN